MKKRICFLFVIIMIICVTGCSRETVVSQEVAKPVKVMEVQHESFPVTLDYIGIVKPNEVKKYSFKSAGIIDKVYVQKGQYVRQGDVIAQLDTKDLYFGVNAAKAQMEAIQAQYMKAVNGATAEEVNQAELNVKKAQSAYNYAEDLYQKMEELYEAGGAPKQELDKVKLELDIRQSELNQAKELVEQVHKGAREEDKSALLAQVEQAKMDYEFKSSLFSNATMKADMNGYIVDVLFKESEMVGAGYPVVVLRGQQSIVSVGLSQKDVALVNIGTMVNVRVNETELEGRVSNINQVPDSQTRTYDVEISLPNNNFQMGSIVRVAFKVSEEKAIIVPIISVLTNNGDYVYVADGETVVRKDVKLGTIKGNNVVIEGLSVGEKIVVEGMKNIKVGDKVSIVQ